jgi:hypothetical protein
MNFDGETARRLTVHARAHTGKKSNHMAKERAQHLLATNFL